MRMTCRVLRILGVLTAAWIAFELVSGYVHLQDQLDDEFFSSETQKAGVRAWYLYVAIPFALLALVLVLPYKKLPRFVQLTGATFLCISVVGVVWIVLLPFHTLTGLHLDAVSKDSWITLAGCLVLLVSQLVPILWAARRPEETTLSGGSVASGA